MKRDTSAFGFSPAGIAGIAVLLLGTACERSSSTTEVQRPEPPLHGAALVVGSTIDQWSLLTIPQSGGTAEARDLSDLSRVVWKGETELPPSVEAHALPGGRVLLRAADGAVHTYDAPTDVLVRVGDVEPDARWAGDEAVGLYVSPDGSMLEVSRDGVWHYGLERDVSWAAPAEGGVLVLLEDGGEGGTLWLLRRDQDQPVETGTASVEATGLVTAWGRRAVLVSAGRRGLVFLTVEPIEVAGEVDLSGPVLGMSRSPSSHEIYVALDAPPRLVAVNRFNFESRELAGLSRPDSSIRPTLFGEGILVREEGGALRIPAAGGTPRRTVSEWRSDLPIGLPEARVVTLSDGAIHVADLESGASGDVEGADADRWWVPVHWNPTTAVTTDRLAGEVVRTAPPEESEAEVDSTVLADRMAAAPGLRDEAAPAAVAGPPPGFYAIVGSARQAEGIRSLVRSLQEAGFATQVQDVPDEAGRTWYRGLVGPYRSRSEAEAAARQLLRERRLEAWVTEIAAPGRAREESN